MATLEETEIDLKQAHDFMRMRRGGVAVTPMGLAAHLGGSVMQWKIILDLGVERGWFKCEAHHLVGFVYEAI